MLKYLNKQPREEMDLQAATSDQLRLEGARLLGYFRAMSPENRSLTVRVVRALWKTQGPNTGL